MDRPYVCQSVQKQVQDIKHFAITCMRNWKVLLRFALALKGGVSPVVKSVGTLASSSESLDLPRIPGPSCLGPSTLSTTLHQHRTCQNIHTQATRECLFHWCFRLWCKAKNSVLFSQGFVLHKSHFLEGLLSRSSSQCAPVLWSSDNK